MKPLRNIVIREHCSFSSENELEQRELQESISRQGIKLTGVPESFLGEPDYLGVDQDFKASYYIGASWIIEREISLIVLPKIPRIDITEMLLRAFSITNEEDARYFSNCYKIYFDQQPIETHEDIGQLTPLLLIYYITLLESLVRHGLKKDYVSNSDNLKGKIKGHLLISEHLRKNIITKNEYRNMCRFQSYTEDIPVNRLLKRALVFARRMLTTFMKHHKQYEVLLMKINRLYHRFENISDYVEISEVKSITSNVLFRYYSIAIRVAKEILRRYDYSLSKISEEMKSTPPFWIDMSRLFEMYVLSLLREKYSNEIEFQVKGYEMSQVADYIHKSERFVIDAKYKPQYDSSYEIVDIREISGNARDIKITSHLAESSEEPYCLIIYPSSNGYMDFDGINSLLKADKIGGFRGFFKIGVRLPTL